MPKGERKRYTKEFKLSAVYLMLSKVYAPKEVFQMLDVDRQTVYRRESARSTNGRCCPEMRSGACKSSWPTHRWRTRS